MERVDVFVIGGGSSRSPGPRYLVILRAAFPVAT
jgi:hypothetical protein